VQERYKLEYDYDNKDPAAWRASSFPARYIYEHFIPKILKEEDPQAIYHPSSPWGDGKPTADPTVGDIHQWNRKSLGLLLPLPSSVLWNFHANTFCP
jgi:beta-mannosidase